MRGYRWSIRRRVAATLIAVVAVIGMGVAAPGAGAEPARERASVPASDFLGDGHGPRGKDSRTGTAAPSAVQRTRAGRLGAVRWNAFGTPAAVGPVAAGTPRRPLATGLSGDPVAAARQYLAQNTDLFGIDRQSVDAMDLVLNRPIGTASVVLLRQRFGDLPAGRDGLVAVLVQNGAVVRVTSSLTRDTRTPEPATRTPAGAVVAALRDAGLPGERQARVDVRAVAVPMPAAAPRVAYAGTLIAPDPTDPVAYTSYVDARTGAVLVRDDLVNFDTDNPMWAVFPATPPLALPPGADPRTRWCLTPAPGCTRTVRDPVSGQAWDVSLSTGTPTFTSSGNSANDVVNWGAGTPPTPATPSPDRNYTYPFTDQWHQARCNPADFVSAQRNDGDAAVTNLFAMHNRMHDWAFHLGFTEDTWNLQAVNLGTGGLGGDAEQGRAQANALGGSRNNANQGTPRDGLPPTTNMFLWQPVAGAAYPPCVDGDYDMTVMGHEYTHAITNRMIAGPDTGFTSFLLQASGDVSMTDMRDNMLAADLVRFGGANQDLIWNAFAESGMGQDAMSGPGEVDPAPSFASPFAANATVTLRPLGDSTGAVVRLYVGDYEARAVPVADTDPETPIPDTFQIVPNTVFSFVVAGAGFGLHKFSTLFLPGRAQDLRLNLPHNLASAASGATVTGDGVNVDKLSDDTEGTDWASLTGVAGRTLTIDLPGDRPQLVSTVNVSALLRPAIAGDVDPGGQNRFTALRSFVVLACNAMAADCSTDAGYHQVFASPADAFPGGAFRPVASQLNLRT